MSGIEIELIQPCPDCQSVGVERFLRNKSGVRGTYCTNDEGNQGHFYGDSGLLRDRIRTVKREIADAAETATADTVAVATEEAPPDSPAQARTAPELEGKEEPPELQRGDQEAVAEMQDAAAALIDPPKTEPDLPAEFTKGIGGDADTDARTDSQLSGQSKETDEAPSEIREIIIDPDDRVRLEELLGSKLTGPGDVVGLVWAMKQQLADATPAPGPVKEGQMIPAAGLKQDNEASRTPDGGALVRVYIAQPAAQQAIEKATFNSQTLGVYLQEVLDFNIGMDQFPLMVPITEQPPGTDGLWLNLKIAEQLVSASEAIAIDMKLESFGEYVQQYLNFLASVERFP